jgi:beta-N-acetylhexosaminidase
VTLRAKLIAVSALIAFVAVVSIATQPTRSDSARNTAAVHVITTTTAHPSTTLTPAHHAHHPKALPPATQMTSPTQEAAPLTAVPLQRMVGQMVMGRMDGTSPDQALLDRIRNGEIGSIILFGDNILSQSQLAQLIQELQAAAKAGSNPPLLIATDQEGPPLVKRLPWAAPTISPPTMGQDGPGVAQSQGQATGIALRDSGINVDLAPVSDVAHSAASFIWKQQRSFGMNPATVTAGASGFAAGLQAEGVAPTAKHFPGAGMFPTDTDNALQHANLTPSVDLVPYHQLIAQRLPIIMVSTGFYDNLDPSNPAALSHHIITDVLRGQLGFQGAVMTDDLQRPTGHSTSESAVLAALAGADIVLACSDTAGGELAYSGLLQAAQSNQIPRATIEAADTQVRALKHQYATG